MTDPMTPEYHEEKASRLLQQDWNAISEVHTNRCMGRAQAHATLAISLRLAAWLADDEVEA